MTRRSDRDTGVRRQDIHDDGGDAHRSIFAVGQAAPSFTTPDGQPPEVDGPDAADINPGDVQMVSIHVSGRGRATAVAVGLLIAACASAPSLVTAQSSPAAAMRAYHQAATNKDFKALRQLLSAASLKEFEGAPVPIERILEGLVADVPAAVPDMRNETISGETATIEVRNHRTGRWESQAFVREQGVWKLMPSTEP